MAKIEYCANAEKPVKNYRKTIEQLSMYCFKTLNDRVGSGRVKSHRVELGHISASNDSGVVEKQLAACSLQRNVY